MVGFFLFLLLLLDSSVRAGNLDLALRSVSSSPFHAVIRCDDYPSSQGS